MMTQAAENHEDRNWKYASEAMAWYGWGSPVGIGLFLVCLAAAAALVHYAVLG
jgi:hypothetical protein